MCVCCVLACVCCVLVCVCVLYLCVCACVCEWAYIIVLCIYLFLCAYAYNCFCIYTCFCSCVHMFWHICVCVCVSVCVIVLCLYLCVHIFMCVHEYMSFYVHACMHESEYLLPVWILAYVYLHTCLLCVCVHVMQLHLLINLLFIKKCINKNENKRWN